jgi:hypothetical protein
MKHQQPTNAQLCVEPPPPKGKKRPKEMENKGGGVRVLGGLQFYMTQRKKEVKPRSIKV